MLNSFSEYITFTDTYGNKVAIKKQFIEGIVLDSKTSNIVIKMTSGDEYEMPFSCDGNFFIIIAKIFY